jgi:hypothetical protein
MEQNSLLDSCFILLSVPHFSLTSAQQDVSKVAPARNEQAQRMGAFTGLEGQPAAQLNNALGAGS